MAANINRVSIAGVYLDDIAPVDHCSVEIEAPEYDIYSEDRPIVGGSNFSRAALKGNREITVSYYLPVYDIEQRQEYLSAIYSWAIHTTLQEFVMQKRPGQHANVVFKKHTDPSTVRWTEKLKMVFVIPDSVFEDDTEKAVACGTSFEISTDQPPAWRIETVYASAQSSPSWVLDSAYTLALNGSVGAGTLVIDSSDQTIKLNGTSIIDQMTIASRFFKTTNGLSALIKGAHSIAGNGTFFWRERYL